MSNQKEEEYNELKESELKEIIEFYDIQDDSWENNPSRILLEKQLEQIHKEIDELIDWYRR